MTKEHKETISIELCGHDMEDGRTYVTSENLKGFQFILEKDEEPEAMLEALVPFLKAYLRAEIAKVRPAISAHAYRQRGLNIESPTRKIQFVAEAVAA